MKYVTTVNGREYEIEIDHEQEIVVNGEKFEIDFRQLAEAGMISLLLNHRSLEAIVEARDERWQVLIHGELYEAQVQDERAYRLAKARGTGAAVTGDAAVKAPMPGLIVAIHVAEGDRVSKGDKVIILESMKMENELRAPRDGLVTRVHVQAGASVEKEQALVVIGEDGVQ
jgi:biotin carboxyl carrier protein